MPLPGATELCGAFIKAKGRTCAQVAGHRTDHYGVGRCSVHGGALTKTNKVYAERMRAEIVRRNAQKAIIALKLEAVGEQNPRQVLLDALRKAVGTVDYLERRIWVDSLPALRDEHGEEIPWTDEAMNLALVDHEPDLLQLVKTEGGSHLAEHPLWAMYQTAKRDLVRTAESCHRCGIETAMAEAYLDSGKLIVEVIKVLFDRLGLDMYTEENAVLVREVLASQPALGVG
jgi:hypothetical protein